MEKVEKSNETYILEDEILNKDVLRLFEEVIFCTICKGLLVDAYFCKECQNCFCVSCLDTWKNKSRYCPFKCSNFNVMKANIMQKVLSKLKIKCKNGCDIEIPYDNLALHYNKECKNIDYRKKYFELLPKYEKVKENQRKGVTLQGRFLKSSHHQHIMKIVMHYAWHCDVCMENYNNTESFRCVPCDFDVCFACAKKETGKDVNI